MDTTIDPLPKQNAQVFNSDLLWEKRHLTVYYLLTELVFSLLQGNQDLKENTKYMYTMVPFLIFL